MTAMKLFNLLQTIVGKLNSLAVSVRDETVDTETARQRAHTLVEEFLGAIKK